MSTHTGIVKWFKRDEGFGFIKGTSNPPEDWSGPFELFVHRKYIKTMHRYRKELIEGEAVEFDIGSNRRGPMALNILRKDVLTAQARAASLLHKYPKVEMAIEQAQACENSLVGMFSTEIITESLRG